MNAIGGGVLGGWVLLTMFFGAISSEAAEENVDTLNGLLLLVQIAVIVVFGVNGNAWREKNLISRGFRFLDIIEASTDEAAIGLWMKKETSSNQSVTNKGQ